MRRIAFADVLVGTDPRLAELVLQYATELAKRSSADTVDVPGRIGSGPVQQVSLLLGPASQITVTDDDEPFGEDVTEAVRDLEARIAGLVAPIPQADDSIGTETDAVEPDLDELEALMPQASEDD